MKDKFLEFEIRWSDLDANRHMANSSYTKYCIDSRVHFFSTSGIEASVMNADLGPVIFHEHYYYMKELHMGDKIKMSVCLRGNTEDYKFVELEHNMFNESGELVMYCTLIFTLMNLKDRSIALPTEQLIKAYNLLEKTQDYKIFPSSYTRAKNVPYGRTIND